jgi:hypothetical protein
VTPVEALAIILSVVSLIITTLGFFASLKFYRDGVVLQGKANDALTKIEEKTAFIQAQMGGIFDKTLDAAIGKREAVSESFAQLNEQLEASKTKIIDESLSQIGAAGEQERLMIKEFVANEIEQVQQKVESTRESVEEVAFKDIDKNTFMRINSIVTWEPNRWLSVKEIASRAHLEATLVDGIIPRFVPNILETRNRGTESEYRLKDDLRAICNQTS